MSDGTVIAEFPKNKRERFRISLTEFNGHQLCDLRIMAVDEGEATFTKKGCSIPLRRLAAVIDGLKAAYDRAQREGRFNADKADAA